MGALYTELRTSIELLLASIYWKANGHISRFYYGPPDSPSWRYNSIVDIQYDRQKLLDAALYVRKSAPSHMRGLPIGEIESRLVDFVSDHYWYLSQEIFLTRFECSFGEYVSARPKAALIAALAGSKIFNPEELITVYPLLPVRVDVDFDGGAFFLVAPASLGTKAANGVPTDRIDGAVFPPWRDEHSAGQVPTSWLGVRSATPYASRKLKSAVLGGLALTPHRLERYMFTGRKLFGGYCTIDDTMAYSNGAPHTPGLSADIIVTSDDQPWLTELSRKFDSDDAADRRHIKALEYFYRAWVPGEVNRFPTLFMSLDAIFGDAGKATQSVIELVAPIMRSTYDYKRLKRLFSLRAAVIHGGAPDVYESDNYHRYYVDYGEDPIRDLELIVARSLQSRIFSGLMKERAHTCADLILATTGRVIS